MKITDVHIELLSFSKRDLVSVGDALGRKYTTRTEKIDIVEDIARTVGIDDLRELANRQLGAGRTSLTWVALLKEGETEQGPESPMGQIPATGDEPFDEDGAFTGEAVTIQDVGRALSVLTRVQRPFEDSVRPRELTADPTLVNAQYDGADQVILTMGYSKHLRVMVSGFEINREPEDEFFHVVLRLARGVLEIRANQTLSRRVTGGWIAKFAKALARREQRLYLTQKDVDELRVELSAIVDRHEARHEDENVGYGRQLVTRGVNVDDLADLERFQDDFKDAASVSSDLLFNYPEFGEVRLRVHTQAGSIQCVNHVPNDVMDRVYDALRKVRAERRPKTSPNESPQQP